MTYYTSDHQITGICRHFSQNKLHDTSLAM